MAQQKISRKELLKDDQLVEHAPDIIDWLETNKGVVVRSVAGVLAVAIVVGGWSLWSNSRHAAAAGMLDEGLKAYEPPTPPGATQPPAPKLAEALAAFERAADRGGSSAVGMTGSFYRGRVLVDLGRAAEAAPILEKVAEGAPTAVMAAASRALLATAYEKAGDAEKAAAVLTRLAADPDGVFPADAALLRLGTLREGQGKPAEAKQVYQDLVARFPEGSAAGDARTAIQRLEGQAR